MGDVLGFKAAFRQAVLQIPGVERVEYFGSLETSQFRQGKSDADIIIYGDVSPRDKVKIWELLKELNTKYRLGLETARMLHPTPFFLDTQWKETLFRALFNGHAAVVFQPFRTLGKRIITPTYGEVWRGEKRLDDILGRLAGPAKDAFLYFW